MAVGDIYQAEMYYNIGSELTMNVYHLIEVETSTDDVVAETVAKLLHDVWSDEYTGLLFSDESALTLIRVRRIKPTAGVPSTAIVGSAAFPAVNGGGVAKPLPATSAALISFYTDTHDRNSRGRTFLPGVCEGNQNDGQLTAAAIAELSGFAIVFKNDIVAVAGTTGTFHFAVYSRELGTAKEITQTVPHSNLATQRSRRNHPGIGA